jgi:hypothetical protein
MSATTTPAGWYPDPSGRHELRYWTGADWSEQVANGGVVSSESAAPAAPVTPVAAVSAATAAPAADPFAGYQQAPAADPFAGYQQAPAADPFAGFQQAPAADPFASYQQAPAADPFAGAAPQTLSPFGAQAPGQGFPGGLPPVAPPLQIEPSPIGAGGGRAAIPRRTLILAAVVAVVVVAAAAMFLLGGDDPVATEAPIEPGISANDPAAPTTVPDPAAPTSVPAEGSATTDEGADATDGGTTEGAANVYPQQVVDNFVNACATGQSAEDCQCAIGAIQNAYSLDAFTALEQEYVATGVFPQEMVSVFEDCFA